MSRAALHKRVCLGASIWLFAACAFTLPAQAQSPIAPAVADDERTAVRRGVDYERDRRWLDAIEYYEQALETWPANEQLKYGLRRSKVHFSVDRRYSDKSFLDQMLPQSRSTALVYLDDVLTKVRQHYVDATSPTSFVAHGTESLYLALNNARFLERNLPHAPADAIARVRKTLKDHYWNKPVGGPEGARHVVSEICDLCERELRLASGPVVMEYLFGGCNCLDDYSSYLTPGKLDDLYSNIEGEFVGIGIEMKAETGKGLLLVNVLPESPAEEGGARSGEYITKINGVDCRAMTTEEAAGHLQGAPGSRVRLELTDDVSGAARSTVLTRRAVKVKSVPVAHIVDQVNGIGYVKMTGFQKNTAEELDAALFKLHREGMRALVWDLRGNPGGLLTAAVEVLDRFIEDGVLVSTRGRTGDQNWSYSAQRQGTWNLPLVLLVDGDSASASEIVAGAIRDHHRGVIVGRKTYGKWSVQTILSGPAHTGIRLTTARFYSPSGQTHGKVGVHPDIAVALSAPKHRTGYRGEPRSWDDDQDVQAGLDSLRKQLARR
jgi:carboxyl-terminal processing protease